MHVVWIEFSFIDVIFPIYNTTVRDIYDIVQPYRLARCDYQGIALLREKFSCFTDTNIIMYPSLILLNELIERKTKSRTDMLVEPF